jgi:hypothetical protein
MLNLEEHPRPRQLSKGVLLLFLWLVLPLVIVEIAMTLLEPYVFNGFYQYDPDMGFRVRPNAGGANQFGFNDKDYPLRRSPGSFRILIVGDSFNWAGGKEGNYIALLRSKFGAAADGYQVEVINAGYPMTHTGEQLMMLKKYGLQYEPNLVVLGFFAGNDFADADPNRKRIVVNDIYIDIDKRHEVKFLGYPIVPQSRLLLFVKQKYKIFRETLKNRMTEHDQQPSQQGTFSEDTFLSIESARMDFCKLSSFHQGKYAANINYIFQSISEMRNVLRARNVPLIVAIYPDEFQVNEQLANAIFSKFHLNRDDYDLALLQRVLKSFLDSENIPYIDMLERFREAGKREPMYLLRDAHWNRAGNQLAAEILYGRLSGVVREYFETGVTTAQ